MIDVHDLPAEVAEAIAKQVHALRQELHKNGKNPTPVGTWSLGSNPPLSRDEIYGDHLDAKLNTQRD